VPELYQAYHANEVAADNEYKGKRLYLDAMVGSINKNAFGQVYLVLPNYYDEFDSVQAVLNEDSYGAAGRLQKGMIVSMECDGDGMIIGSPMLNNCSLVARRQAPPVPAPQPVAAEPAPDSAAPPQNPASSQGNTDTGNVQNTDTVKTEDPSPSK
jgi:hypothetical protein